MAKDPAFLFYSNDFLSGTFTMTDEQVGKYIRLLCLQHQKETLTKKDMMNICKTYDRDIFEKFVLENGVYYNVKLREVAEKRKAYSESRRKNRQNEKTYDKHMEIEDENVIVNKDDNTGKEIFEKWNDFAGKYGLATITVISPARERGISARLQESAFNFDKVLEEIANSKFARGSNDRKWKIDFDWIFLSPNNFAKLLEGKYRNKPETINEDPNWK